MSQRMARFPSLHEYLRGVRRWCCYAEVTEVATLNVVTMTEALVVRTLMLLENPLAAMAILRKEKCFRAGK
jgi:hypothetical protein